MNHSWIAVSLVEVSVGLAALLALFLLSRPLLRRVVGSRWLHGLWLIVLARLLVPWPVETEWSLVNRQSKRAEQVLQSAEAPEVRVKFGEAARTTENTAQSVTAEVQSVKSQVNWNVLGVVWMGGAGIGTILLGYQWWQTRRWAAQTRPADNPQLLAAFELIPAQWRAGVELRQTDALPLATLAGIRNPQIWFPNRWLQELNSEELRSVLLHELGHVRRHDLLAQWFFNVAVCLHWFNPLVWIAARASRFDREMACDAWVLERAGEDGQEQYGETLLRIVQLLRAPTRISPAVLAMAANRKTLKARIEQIGAFQTSSVWRGIVATCMMLGLVAVVTTTRASAKVPSPPADTGAGAVSDSSTKGDTVPQPVTGAGTKDTPLDVPGPFAFAPQVYLNIRVVEITESAVVDLSKRIAELQNLAAAVQERVPVRKTDIPDLTPAQNDSLITVLNPEQRRALDRIFGDRDEWGLPIGKPTVEGVKLIAAPRVTAASGQQASIESGSEFTYTSEFEKDPTVPDKWIPKKTETENLGLFVGFLAHVAADQQKLDLDLTIRRTELRSHAAYAGPGRYQNINDAPDNTPQIPVFSRWKLTTSINVSAGQTILIGKVVEPGTTDNTGKAVEARAELMIVTPTILPPRIEELLKRNAAAPNSAKTETSPSAPAKLPVATWVQGKPGFALSPFAPNAGYVDLRGIPTGAEVKCPYSGKMFAVPGAIPESGEPAVTQPTIGAPASASVVTPQKDKVVESAEVPVELVAESSSTQDGITVAQTNAVLRYKGTELAADKITYDSKTKVARGLGNVRYTENSNVVEGGDIQLDLTTMKIRITGPSRTKIAPKKR